MIGAMRYPGGKGKCYQRIINLMPAHTVFIESHLGGGAVMRHKKPAVVNIGVDIDTRVIQQWQKVQPPICQLVLADATVYLEQYPFTGTELVYCDPPYVKATRRQARVYRYDFEDEDHQRLLDVLKALPCMVLLSGYDNPLYAKALADWGKTSFRARTRVDMREECLWFNFEPKASARWQAPWRNLPRTSNYQAPQPTLVRSAGHYGARSTQPPAGVDSG